MPLDHAFEKLNAAMRALICLDVPLSDRLHAASAEISLVKPEKDLPPDFRKQFDLLVDKIHAYRSENMPAAMQPEIAWDIFDLFKKLVSFTQMSK